MDTKLNAHSILTDLTNIQYILTKYELVTLQKIKGTSPCEY